MKLFLDANVLISVLNHELPIFPFSSRILSLAETNPNYTLYTSPLCLAITYNFSVKHCGNERSMEKMQILSQKLKISPITESEILALSQNKKVKDYEDGMQYYSALHSGCDAIITENVKDFYFAEIGVFDCRDFILNQLVKN